MEFVVLLFFEIVLLFFEIKLIKKSIFSISFISTSTILMSTLAALYSKKLWNLNVTGYTLITLIVGMLIMFVSELIAQKIVISKKKQLRENEKGGYIKINNIALIGINIIIFLCVILYFGEVMRAGTMLGGSGFDCIAIVKESYMKNPSGNYMNMLIRQLFKIVIATAYIFTFIFINNILIEKKLKGNWYYLFPIVMGIFITIIAGSRGNILKILAAAVFDFYIINLVYSKENIAFFKRIIYKFSKVFVALIILLFIVMFLSKKIVKTADVATSNISNILDYVAFYAGSPIAVLNEKINIKYNNGDFFVGNNLITPEFVYLGNLNYGGNVSTIFGISLLKYGFFGMCLYIFCIYFTFATLIHSVEKEQEVKCFFSTKVIVISYLFNFIIFAFYTDLTSELFNFSNILTIISIIFISKLIKFVRINN